LHRHALLYGSRNIQIPPILLQKVSLCFFSDIWSLGVILYEICNLRLPFEAQHYNALAMKILKASYPSIMPTYSKQLRDLIASMLAKKPQDRPTIIDVLNKPFIKPRLEKYVHDLLSRNSTNTDMEDIYLDTLRDQALALGVLAEEENIKKYPSSKDLDKKLPTHKSFLNKRSEDEDNELIAQYHSKRKSTFEKEAHSNEKNFKRQEESTVSSKGLNLGYDFSDEKEAFVDHKKYTMMEKIEGKKAGDSSKEKRFRIFEDYSMEEENAYTQIEAISEEIIKEEESESEEQTVNAEEEEEVPESYNNSYYKLLHKIKMLKHRCETALGSNRYLRAYNAVNNGANKTALLEILQPTLIGYWHLIDQIMFN